MGFSLIYFISNSISYAFCSVWFLVLRNTQFYVTVFCFVNMIKKVDKEKDPINASSFITLLYWNTVGLLVKTNWIFLVAQIPSHCFQALNDHHSSFRDSQFNYTFFFKIQSAIQKESNSTHPTVQPNEKCSIEEFIWVPCPPCSHLMSSCCLPITQSLLDLYSMYADTHIQTQKHTNSLGHFDLLMEGGMRESNRGQGHWKCCV